MAKKPKEPFIFESNYKKIAEKVRDKPYRVLNTIGANLVKEIRPKVLRRKGGGKLARSLGYWARKKEQDLQIGFYEPKYPNKEWAAFYSNIVYADIEDPITPVVRENIMNIHELINEALDEIRKERE